MTRVMLPRELELLKRATDWPRCFSINRKTFIINKKRLGSISWDFPPGSIKWESVPFYGPF